MIFCGVDVGTQGARCLLVSETGEVLGQGESGFEEAAVPGLPDGWFEQNPAHWIAALSAALLGAVQGLTTAGHDVSNLAAISVTSTSGTLCPVTAEGEPLGRAIMYNDSRSSDEATAVQKAGGAVADVLGYRFGASFGLPKILWLKRHQSGLFARARWLISPTDYVIGWLTGRWGRADQTNALKFGYDLLEGRWPDYIQAVLGLRMGRFPMVQMTGQQAGDLRTDRASELGLPPGIPVAAGLTDGCASQISSGAVAPGEFNTTIGTTLVIKGVTERLIVDPQGRLYCHKHPEGWWLPGGASNTGAECLSRQFSDEEVDALSADALSVSPTGLVIYPLVGRGERYPFRCEHATAFMLGRAAGTAEFFTGCLEGVACLERLAFEMLEELGAEVGERIYSAGGGSRSDAWLQIRADTLGRTVVRPAVTGGAMGAAIVAASMVQEGTLTDAARRMVRIEREVPPRADMLAAYEAKYQQFKDECRRREYIE